MIPANQSRSGLIDPAHNYCDLGAPSIPRSLRNGWDTLTPLTGRINNAPLPQKRRYAPIIGSAVCVKRSVEVKSDVRSGAL